MERTYRWYEHVGINMYWLGQSFASGVLTPILLPYLVLLFVPDAQKNTYLASVNIVGLAVAMLVQPIAGMLSDRSTSRWGRRRPFIMTGALLNALAILLIGLSPQFGKLDDPTAKVLFGVVLGFAVLQVANICSQFSANIAQGPLQGLMPDLIPEKQRGFSSGIKSVFELLPSLMVLGISPLVNKGYTLLTAAIVSVILVVTMAVTVFSAHEEPQTAKPEKINWEPYLRMVGLTALFVAITQLAVWLVNLSGGLTSGSSVAARILLVGLAGMIGMAGAIFIGVYFGASLGIGKEAGQQKSFIWWVINRLMFLAAVGAIQRFAMYFLKDVLKIQNAATMTSILLALVALFLIPSALFGGRLADRVGKKRLVSASGYIASAGAFLLVLSGFMASSGFLSLSQTVYIGMVLVSGCVIGLGTGAFMATNWALGTSLVPPTEAGKFLGISNLAGAGAGIVGAGIGGPLADYFNAVQPGLGYLVIFFLYAVLFLLSVVALGQVKMTENLSS